MVETRLKQEGQLTGYCSNPLIQLIIAQTLEVAVEIMKISQLLCECLG